MTQTQVELFTQDPNNLRLFLQERSIYEVTALIEEVMDEKGVSRADLAKLLGKSKGWVTQLLDGEANKTIRTVADVFAVLGREFRAFQKPIQISNAPNRRPTLSRRVPNSNPSVIGIYDGSTTKSDLLTTVIQESA